MNINMKDRQTKVTDPRRTLFWHFILNSLSAQHEFLKAPGTKL